MIMRKILLLILCGGCMAIYSCTGQSADEAAVAVLEPENTTVASAQDTSANLTEKNLPESLPVINTDEPSDSKGTGKYKEVQIGKTIDNALARKGEQVFKLSCAACHTSTSTTLVGPGLKGITKKRTPAWIMNMINDPERMTKEDPVAAALLKKHNQVQMTNQHVTDKDTRALLEFLRKNDEGN